ELPGQPDIGDVGDPDLIEPRRDKTTRQIGNDRELMPAVGCVGNERLLAQAQQIVLAHEAQDVLVVDLRRCPKTIASFRETSARCCSSILDGMSLGSC